MNGDWGLLYLLGIPFRTRVSRSRMKAMNDRRLGWLVRHAANSMPFYRDLLEKEHIDPGTISGLDDLGRLPLVSRAALNRAGESAWARDLAPGKRIMATTSGSTGSPLELTFRYQDRLRKHAIAYHSMSRLGWRPWHRGFALGIQALPRGHIFEKFGINRWHWIDPTRPVSEWLEEYDRLRPQAVHSYPSALREFCFEVRKRGPLKSLPRMLTVAGETYSEELNPLVKEIFGRTPLNVYAAVECGRLAVECRARNGLHVRPDSVHVEILKNGRPAEPGEEGSVVITSLINTTMPIIRYQLGDVATWAPGECTCGSWWPRLTLCQGRDNDVVELPGGRRVPVTRLDSIVGKSRAIRQFQFLRSEQNELTLRYQLNDSNCERLDEIRNELGRVLPGVRIHLQQSGQLPRTRSGKILRYIDESAGTGKSEESVKKKI